MTDFPWFAAALLAALATAPVAAPPVPTPVAAPVPPTSAAVTLLRANTIVELETVDSVSSRASQPRDLFRLRVTRDVVVDGVVAIPAGSEAIGQVVHAARSAAGGKAGELIVAARSIRLPAGEVKLRSGFGAAGKQRTGAALATALAVGVFGMLVHGKELELPAGTPLSARVATDTLLPPS
jgi:hypothetical protein